MQLKMQELLNLLLCGCAVSNVFDGTKPLGDSGLTLRGVPCRQTVGYLSHLESLRYLEVSTCHATTSIIVLSVLLLVSLLLLPQCTCAL
jgi:Domain of unknown function (DUF4205)